MSSRKPKTAAVTVLLSNLHASETETNRTATNHPTETQILAARCKDEPHCRREILRPKPNNTIVIRAKNLQCNLHHSEAKRGIWRRPRTRFRSIFSPQFDTFACTFSVK